MQKREPRKIDKSTIIDALRIGFGETACKSYLTNELAQTILPEILGQMVCSYFTEIKNNNGRLTIKISSVALKSNLILEKTHIIEKINNKIGFKFVNEIIFL